MDEQNRQDEIKHHAERQAESRKRWARGPWDNEQTDREEFEHLGLSCIVQRGGSGAWCGYVGISPGHRLHGMGYSGTYDAAGEYTGSPVADLNIHGGITYADKCSGSVCHIPKPGQPEDVWWLGFDCAHYRDLTPTNGDYTGWDGIYRDIEWVKEETRRLAEQLVAQ